MILKSLSKRNFSIKLSDFAKFKPHSGNYKLENYYNGKWNSAQKYESFLNPINGDKNFMEVPLTQSEKEIHDIVSEMKSIPSSGMHNPLKNPERYLLYGNISRKVSQALHQPEIYEHFISLINTVFPKSRGQSEGEMRICRNFFDNFGGDNVRYLARGFHNPGDFTGQQTNGFRWPYGGVSIISPFNFPLEIPILQVMGSLFMGNKPLVKCDSKVALPFEEFLRLLLACGLPKEDIILVHSDGHNTEKIITNSDLKMTLFTGSSKVAHHLSTALNGRIKIEDAGLDWKILGPDVPNQKRIDYIAHMIDHDSYALSGQKCSAESLLFVHENWKKTDLYEKVKAKALNRKFKDLTICPIMSWNNTKIQKHVDKVLQVEGAQLLFGGAKVKEANSVPDCYGLYEPTAIKVPLEAFLNKKNYPLLTQELFGPYQIVTEYSDKDIDVVLKILDGLENKLTCAVVSNDEYFLNKVLGSTSNGTTYAGLRSRTTGAPQNHWFGPGGDPRAGGIGSIEAIQQVWSHHREIVYEKIIPDSIVMIQS